TTELSLLLPAQPLWPEDIPFAELERTVLDLDLLVLAHADGFTQGHHLLEKPAEPLPQRWRQRWEHPANPRLVGRISKLAAERKVARTELALAWLLSQRFRTI